MKILKINSQYRRDFYADLECDHCGHIEKNVSCYDDAYFHQTVIPEMECKKCGKMAKDDYRPLSTKYREGEVV